MTIGTGTVFHLRSPLASYHLGVKQDVHQLAAQRLRRISQRYTAGRRRIVEVLAAAGHPLTIPEIVGSDSDLATSSVYRNLVTLEHAGVATRIVTSQEHARFELSEPFNRHHHHLVCVDCGKVDDFILPKGVEESLDSALRRAAQKEGFAPTDHRLDLTGTCPDCQAAG